MNHLLRDVIAGGVIAAIGAAITDIDAWRKSGDVFDWKLAAKRWVQAFATGAFAGFAGSDVK